MRALIVLALVAGCYEINTEDDLSATARSWTGTIAHDGVTAGFTGYDPVASETELGDMSAVGWLGPDGAQLVYVDLTFEGLADVAASHPAQLALQQRFLTGESGVALSYVESLGTGDSEFRIVYLEGGADTVTGTLVVGDTDWSSYFVGTLTATLHDDQGRSRVLALAVRWSGPKP